MVETRLVPAVVLSNIPEVAFVGILVAQSGNTAMMADVRMCIVADLGDCWDIATMGKLPCDCELSPQVPHVTVHNVVLCIELRQAGADRLEIGR